MVGYLIKSIIVTSLYASDYSKEIQWLYKDKDDLTYNNLTDEAKAVFEYTLNNSENAEDNVNIYASLYLLSYWQEVDNGMKLTMMLSECIFSVMLITIIIYFAITVEFKSMKKYCKNNLKVLLVMFIFCTSTLLYVHILFTAVNVDGYEVVIDAYQLLSLLTFTVLCYCAFLLPNIIINVIKERKNRKKNTNKA